MVKKRCMMHNSSANPRVSQTNDDDDDYDDDDYDDDDYDDYDDYYINGTSTSKHSMSLGRMSCIHGKIQL